MKNKGVWRSSVIKVFFRSILGLFTLFFSLIWHQDSFKGLQGPQNYYRKVGGLRGNFHSFLEAFGPYKGLKGPYKALKGPFFFRGI